MSEWLKGKSTWFYISFTANISSKQLPTFHQSSNQSINQPNNQSYLSIQPSNQPTTKWLQNPLPGWCSWSFCGALPSVVQMSLWLVPSSSSWTGHLPVSQSYPVCTHNHTFQTISAFFFILDCTSLPCYILLLYLRLGISPRHKHVQSAHTITHFK